MQTSFPIYVMEQDAHGAGWKGSYPTAQILCLLHILIFCISCVLRWILLTFGICHILRTMTKWNFQFTFSPGCLTPLKWEFSVVTRMPRLKLGYENVLWPCKKKKRFYVHHIYSHIRQPLTTRQHFWWKKSFDCSKPNYERLPACHRPLNHNVFNVHITSL